MAVAKTRKLLLTLILVVSYGRIGQARMLKQGSGATAAAAAAGPQPASDLQNSIPAAVARSVNIECPDGCRQNQCLSLSGGGSWCNECVTGLVRNSRDGTCGCPSGKFSVSGPGLEAKCVDCPKGDFCRGGSFETALNVPCGEGLTTLGQRASAPSNCVNVPGTYIQYDASGTPSAVTCPQDTYSPGFRKQRACVPCPPGFTTQGNNGSTSSSACGVPAGYFLEGPGQVAPCPMGEYNTAAGPGAGGPNGACQRCPTGVTTPSGASASIAACTVLLPGYMPATMVDGYVAATQRCPQNYYCPGGMATAAFDPTTAAAPTTGPQVVRCPGGTWTEQIGATSQDMCMVPPGFGMVNGSVQECPDGYFRGPEWMSPQSQPTCEACGEGFTSQATETISVFAPTPDAMESTLAMRADDHSCYARPGQGVYFNAASKTFRAVYCSSGQYGLASGTYGRDAHACRSCSTGTTTDDPSSAQYWVESEPGQGGFTSLKACVVMAGYGRTGRIATRCPAGIWSAAGTGVCVRCPYGMTTAFDPAAQVSADNCTLAPGYGWHHNGVQQCPTGTYNDALRSDKTTPCTACPIGLTTSEPGASSLGQCDLCAEGYGGPGCATPCGTAGQAAAYGPADRPAGSDCVKCPSQTAGFHFNFGGTSQQYAPALVTRAFADNPADCVNEFNQFGDTAWEVGGTVDLEEVPEAKDFPACVKSCKADERCQYITYDYSSSSCSKKVAGDGSDLLAFKNTAGGDVTASSTASNKTSAKALASGSYTFYKDDATGVGAGAKTATTAVTSVDRCLALCTVDATCVLAVMTGVTQATLVPTSCRLVSGETTMTGVRRSMTKSNVQRVYWAELFQA